MGLSARKKRKRNKYLARWWDKEALRLMNMSPVDDRLRSKVRFAVSQSRFYNAQLQKPVRTPNVDVGESFG